MTDYTPDLLAVKAWLKTVSETAASKDIEAAAQAARVLVNFAMDLEATLCRIRDEQKTI